MGSDESCDFAVVRALRAAGRDVVAIAESRSGIADRNVMALAEAERRRDSLSAVAPRALAGMRQSRACPSVAQPRRPFDSPGT